MTREQWETSDEYLISTPDCSSLSLEDDHSHDQLFPFSSKHFHQINTSSSPLGTSSISTGLSPSPQPLSTSHQDASNNSDNDAFVANFDINDCDATVFNADDTELYGMLAAGLLHFDTANESGIDLVVIANDAGLYPVSQGNEKAATASSTSTTLSHTTAVTPAHAPVVSAITAHSVSRVEDRKERRKRQNREAAKKFRKNQQQQVTNLIKLCCRSTLA